MLQHRHQKQNTGQYRIIGFFPPHSQISVPYDESGSLKKGEKMISSCEEVTYWQKTTTGVIQKQI